VRLRALHACAPVTFTLDGSMYRVPPDLDLTPFVGATLHQICVGKFDVQFRFDSGAWIAVQSTARISGENIASEWCEATGWDSTQFYALLNERVAEVAVKTEREFEFRFVNGLTLQFVDLSDQYESMQIYYPGATVPIVI
jgi:hypothetical protein